MSELKGIESFFLYGYYLDEYSDIDFSYFKELEFKDCNISIEEQFVDEKHLNELQTLQSLLGKKYIEKVFTNYQLRSYGMWDGVDEGSSRWHNDFLDGDSFNSNILVYLDDNNEKNGNSIEVRGPQFSHKLYPKNGQLLWLNQKKIFQHRATHTSGRRRILSFEYFIPELI